jgi:hypothetical protein
LEGWWREKRRQKNLQKYRFYFSKKYIFWRAGQWKIGSKKPQKYKFYFLTYIFWKARENRSATKKTKNIYVNHVCAVTGQFGGSS